MRVSRLKGQWGHTRVRWTPSDDTDVIRYAQVVREVVLHRDGGITYSDLRALERGNWQLQAAKLDTSANMGESGYVASVIGQFEELCRQELTPLPVGDHRRAEQIYVCQPDHQVVNDLGTAGRIIKPIPVRNPGRWKEAVRACYEVLRPKLIVSGPGTYVEFEPTERRVSAFQRMIKGLSLLGVVCFVPPTPQENQSLHQWLFDMLPPADLVVLAVYAAGTVAVYSARSWAELQPLCQELPHGECYVALPCRPTRGGE